VSDYGLNGCMRDPITHQKTADEIIVVPFYWAARLNGETISTRSFELPDGLANDADAASGTITTIRLSGGSDGLSYRVIGKITTSGSRTLEEVRRVIVRDE
jgi:hypothetical protein